MSSFSELNTYAGTAITFTVDTIQTSRTVGASFDSPVLTWEPVRQLGELSGTGIYIEYDVSSLAGTTVTFPNSGNATNTLTVTNPSAGVYRISGILDIIDYNAARATINPPVAATGTLVYNAYYINTNNSDDYFDVDIEAIP